MTLEQFFIVAGAPSAVVGGAVSLMYWRLKKQIELNMELQRQHDAARLQHEKFLVSMLTAVSAVCEANAIAMQNGRCNGETHAALEYLHKVKREQREFMTAQGLEHIYNCER